MSIGSILGVLDNDRGKTGREREGNFGFGGSVQGIEKEARIQINPTIFFGGDSGGDFGIVFTVFVGDGMNRESIRLGGFADNGTVGGS